MSQNSAIEWTDATWNPVRGCTKVSPGCANCYAETFAERWRGVNGHAYEQGFDLRLVPEKLDEPLRRKKPTTYFVNSMSDLFQDGVPDEFIAQVFATMRAASRHTFQILTKRAARMRAVVGSNAFRSEVDRLTEPRAWPDSNVWLGVSVENQHFADERIPLLLKTPAAVRFISAEPLLEHVNLGAYLPVETIGGVEMERWLNWVIVGGESGPGARSFDADWARSIVHDCRASGVPVFVKQLGADAYDSDLTESGADEGLRLKSSKGGDMAEWPEDLRVREFPRTAA